jgi:3',5'-cyclic AMP phosphodiesterase CpdA
MKRFGVIQIADVQFGKNHRFGSPSNIARKLALDINWLAEKHSFFPVYIVVAGDIVETGHASEFEDARTQITRLAQDVKIDTDSILFVPGNHDVSWPLSRASVEVGDASLKLNTYQKFVADINQRSLLKVDSFSYVIDWRLGVVFLLVDTCDQESHEVHKGFVDLNKLVKTIEKFEAECGGAELTRICVMHHRLTALGSNVKSCVENAREVEAILRSKLIDIVLTGHVHEATVFCEIRDGRGVIYTGVGSAGVDKSQRGDGVQNQYGIHIIDRAGSCVETLWRCYNPSRGTSLGLGGWVGDNSVPDDKSKFSLPQIKLENPVSKDYLQDGRLVERLGVGRNPFIFSNAEKISPELILELFVSDEARHKGAKRLSGDAIIRGSRGAGKTMLLRFLDLYGSARFKSSLENKEIAECFPVLVNFAVIHPSDIGRDRSTIYRSADNLIYRSIIAAFDRAADELRKPAFKDAVYRVKQRIDSLNNVDATLVSKLGGAIREYLTPYFRHVLLLIDEIAPVFPKDFFVDVDTGFLYWMNSIRNSGPFYTRVAVYPNDQSDILNEERFGALVNLDFNVRNPDECQAFYEYCIDLVNRYLASVSCDQSRKTVISDVLEFPADRRNDGLEQLIYASDGSPRRFLSLMDKCFNAVVSAPGEGRAKPLSKESVLTVIKEYSRNLVNSYSVSEQEVAASIAQVCRKQVTFRFRAPGLTPLLSALHSAREEFNVVKLAEVGAGRRGSTYEFTYPYCVLMDIQTHFLRDTRRVCSSRDRLDGDWINVVTTVQKEQIESLTGLPRISGSVLQIDGCCAIIKTSEGNEYWCDEPPDGASVGAAVSFLVREDIAVDVALF